MFKYDNASTRGESQSELFLLDSEQFVRTANSLTEQRTVEAKFQAQKLLFGPTIIFLRTVLNSGEQSSMSFNQDLRLEDAMNMVRTKKHLYESMIRNNYYLPSINSPCITEEYMQMVRNGTVWCPTFTDIRKRPCPRPPTKEFLFQEVMKETTEKGLQLGLDMKKLPNKQWLLDILSTLNSEHLVFQKNYLPVSKMTVHPQGTVNNQDGFYDSLPSMLRKRDLKKKSRLKEYKILKQQEKVERLKRQKSQISTQLAIEIDTLKLKTESCKTVRVPEEQFKLLMSKVKELEEQLQNGKKAVGGKQSARIKNRKEVLTDPEIY